MGLFFALLPPGIRVPAWPPRRLLSGIGIRFPGEHQEVQVGGAVGATGQVAFDLFLRGHIERLLKIERKSLFYLFIFLQLIYIPVLSLQRSWGTHAGFCVLFLFSQNLFQFLDSVMIIGFCGARGTLHDGRYFFEFRFS